MRLVKRIQSRLEASVLLTSGLLAGAFVLSKLVGLVRQRLLTATFGSGGVLDSFLSAFIIPDLVYNILILGTLSSAFIPLFSELIHTDNASKEDANRLADNVFFITGAVMGLLGVIMLVGAPYIAEFVGQSYTGEKLTDTITLTRIMAFSPLIFSLSTVVTSVLQAHNKFVVTSLSAVMYQIGIIIGISILYPMWGVVGLGYGVILGALLHVMIQLPSLYALGFGIRPRLKLQTVGLKRLWSLYWPRLLVLDISLLAVLVGKIIASREDAGVSIFTLAYDVNSLPLGIISISLVTAMFPQLSRVFAQGKRDAFIAYVMKTMARMLSILVPAAGLLVLLRKPVIHVIFDTSKFTTGEVTDLLWVLTIFAVSLPFQGLLPLFARGFYAQQKPKIPMIIGGVSMLVSIGLSWGAYEAFGLRAVAVVFAGVMVAAAFVYGVWLCRSVKCNIQPEYLRWFRTIGLFSVMTWCLAWGINELWETMYVSSPRFFLSLIQVICVGGVSAAVYVFIAWRSELRDVFRESEEA